MDPLVRKTEDGLLHTCPACRRFWGRLYWLAYAAVMLATALVLVGAAVFFWEAISAVLTGERSWTEFAAVFVSLSVFRFLSAIAGTVREWIAETSGDSEVSTYESDSS